MGHRAWVMATWLLSAGCVADNPAFNDTDGGTSRGAAGPASDEVGDRPETGSSTDAKTTAPDDATTATSQAAATTNDDPSGPGSTDATSDSAGVTSGAIGSSGGDEATTAERTDPATEGDIASIVLFASLPVPGSFALGSDHHVDAGEEVCWSALDEDGLDLDCAWMVPILATTAESFVDLADEHPALSTAEFHGMEGDPLAESYENLVDGIVPPGFADAVTGHLGAAADPTFWWGPQAAEQPDCLGWTAVETAGEFGRTLTFGAGELGGSVVDDDPCQLPRHLLCACAQE